MSQKKSSGNSLNLKNLSSQPGFEPTTPKKEAKSQNQIQRQPDTPIEDGVLPNLGLLYYRHYYKNNYKNNYGNNYKNIDWEVLVKMADYNEAKNIPERNRTGEQFHTIQEYEINQNVYKTAKSTPEHRRTDEQINIIKEYEKNKNILTNNNVKITERTAAEYQNTTMQVQGTQILDLQVIGQGLLVGSGYQHATGIEGESKLGFFFDYTTGLPIIPGSSVKGALRHAFKQVAVLQHFLAHKVAEKHRLVLTKEEIGQLEAEIFENKNEKEEYLPTPQRDIFFDATLDTNEPYKFLGKDFITPHINRKKPELSRFSDPIPLLFLKILPQTRFTFQFSLHHSQAVSGFTSEHKLALFEVILKYYGIGAKTNVGYGHFVP